MRRCTNLVLFILIGLGSSSCAGLAGGDVERALTFDVAEAPDVAEALDARGAVASPIPPTPPVPRGQGAAASPSTDEAPEDEWRFVIAPYLWLLNVDGTAVIDGTALQIDEDTGDLLDKLNFAIEGRFEAWKGRRGFLLDASYWELENDISLGPVGFDTNTEVKLALIGAMYRFVDQEREPGGAGGAKVDGILGVGYTAIDGEIDFTLLPDVDGDDSWFDPFVGLRSRWAFSENWMGSLEGILGGFELLDGADLFTIFNANVGRRLGEDTYLYFGWRSLDIDYDDGSDLELDLRLSRSDRRRRVQPLSVGSGASRPRGARRGSARAPGWCPGDSGRSARSARRTPNRPRRGGRSCTRRSRRDPPRSGRASASPR